MNKFCEKCGAKYSEGLFHLCPKFLSPKKMDDYKRGYIASYNSTTPEPSTHEWCGEREKLCDTCGEFYIGLHICKIDIVTNDFEKGKAAGHRAKRFGR